MSDVDEKLRRQCRAAQERSRRRATNRAEVRLDADTEVLPLLDRLAAVELEHARLLGERNEFVRMANEALDRLFAVEECAKEFGRSVSLWTGDIIEAKIRASTTGPVGVPAEPVDETPCDHCGHSRHKHFDDLHEHDPEAARYDWPDCSVSVTYRSEMLTTDPDRPLVGRGHRRCGCDSFVAEPSGVPAEQPEQHCQHARPLMTRPHDCPFTVCSCVMGGQPNCGIAATLAPVAEPLVADPPAPPNCSTEYHTAANCPSGLTHDPLRSLGLDLQED